MDHVIVCFTLRLSPSLEPASGLPASAFATALCRTGFTAGKGSHRLGLDFLVYDGPKFLSSEIPYVF